MQNDNCEWNFFLAHAGTDVELAERLYDQLASESRVFLDSRCLSLGDDWDAELASAQRRSLISVVLVSKSTTAAYYQREEIAAAIALAREASDRHRVVPIYIDNSAEGTEVPYGLRLKHGISLGDECSLDEAAIQLLDLRRSLDSECPVVSGGGTHESKVIGTTSARGLEIECFGGINFLVNPTPDLPGFFMTIHVHNTRDRTYDDVRRRAQTSESNRVCT